MVFCIIRGYYFFKFIWIVVYMYFLFNFNTDLYIPNIVESPKLFAVIVDAQEGKMGINI